MKKMVISALIFILFSCSQSSMSKLKNDRMFELTEISTDKTYGLTPENAVQVGGADKSQGPKNERRYLNALAGPNGEEISYYRAGSCCPVKSDKGFLGMAMLDRYMVTWEGSKDTISIYINMYDYGKLRAPYGFTIRK